MKCFACSFHYTEFGRDRGQEEKGMTEDEMAGWHHWLDGRESEWTPGVGDGQGVLACCNSWGHKESDTTERLNWTELSRHYLIILKKDKWFTINSIKIQINLGPKDQLQLYSNERTGSSTDIVLSSLLPSSLPWPQGGKITNHCGWVKKLGKEQAFTMKIFH